MTPEGLTALLQPGAWELFNSLPPYSERKSLALGERLRREGVPADLVATMLTQSRLRAAGAAKFGDFAASMLFTAAGLEQATRLNVAARHAARFLAAGADQVADLGCGIGGDAMALAGVDLAVLAVERDELTAAVATVNLRHFDRARVVHQDLADVDLSGVDALFLDPARRTATGRRVHDPRQGQPSFETVLGLAQRFPQTGVKLAPGVPHELLPGDTETQWVSVGGELVEAGLWLGGLARPGVARAALLIGAESAELVWPDHSPPRAPVGTVDNYLLEPDPAVIRAGLVGPLALQLGLHGIDPTIAYLASPTLPDSPFLSAYRVQEDLPFGLKRLRAHLRDRGIGRVEIKKRGTAVEPEELRRQLRLTGDGSATVVLTRVQGQQRVLVCEPVRRHAG